MKITTVGLDIAKTVFKVHGADALPGSGLLASTTPGTPPTTTYFHGDHLDWRISTDANGNLLGQQGNYPFGESWYSSNGNQYVFTSYQRDGESGLDYALARYYDSTAARFCSADPVGGRPDDPQSWNRYAYVQNDPVNLTDPSGRGFLSWLGVLFRDLANFLTPGGFGNGFSPGGGGGGGNSAGPVAFPSTYVTYCALLEGQWRCHTQ